MSYFIFGGSGFIGTHLIALIDNLYPGTKIYNLDIVENNHEVNLHISIVMFVLK